MEVLIRKDSTVLAFSVHVTISQNRDTRLYDA